MDLDIDHLRGWIGKEECRSEVLSPALVERIYATLGSVKPASEGEEAPLMVHFCLAQPVAGLDRLGPDGHPKRGGFLPPVSLPPDVGGRRDHLPRAASDRRDGDADIAD